MIGSVHTQFYLDTCIRQVCPLCQSCSGVGLPLLSITHRNRSTLCCCPMGLWRHGVAPPPVLGVPHGHRVADAATREPGYLVRQRAPPPPGGGGSSPPSSWRPASSLFYQLRGCGPGVRKTLTRTSSSSIPPRCLKRERQFQLSHTCTIMFSETIPVIWNGGPVISSNSIAWLCQVCKTYHILSCVCTSLYCCDANLENISIIHALHSYIIIHRYIIHHR